MPRSHNKFLLIRICFCLDSFFYISVEALNHYSISQRKRQILSVFLLKKDREKDRVLEHSEEELLEVLQRKAAKEMIYQDAEMVVLA